MKKTHAEFFKEKKPWSIFKDEILKNYLVPYFQKILSTHKPLIYIDGYAGKGMFDDGNPGSPIIALNAIDEALIKTKAKNPRITSYFIEKEFSKDLTANLDGRQNINIIDGCFQDHVDDILKKVGNENVFLYIDPFGVRDLNMEWFNNLIESNYYSIEFLLNFQSLGFFRWACSAMDVTYEEGERDACTIMKKLSTFLTIRA